MCTKVFKDFLSFKQADACHASLPFELLCSWRIPTIPGHRAFGSTAPTSPGCFYECTTIGRKWAEVFFLRVFCPLLGAPFPFKATYICLPLCCQLKDAYVLYPFSSILSFSLQSLLNSFCKVKTKISYSYVKDTWFHWTGASCRTPVLGFVCCWHLYARCALNNTNSTAEGKTNNS